MNLALPFIPLKVNEMDSKIERQKTIAANLFFIVIMNEPIRVENKEIFFLDWKVNATFAVSSAPKKNYDDDDDKCLSPSYCSHGGK